MTDLRTRLRDLADNLDYYAGKTDGGTYAGGLQDAAGQIRAALAGVQDGGECQQSDWCGPGSHCLCPSALAPQAGDGAR